MKDLTMSSLEEKFKKLPDYKKNKEEIEIAANQAWNDLERNGQAKNITKDDFVSDYLDRSMEQYFNGRYQGFYDTLKMISKDAEALLDIEKDSTTYIQMTLAVLQKFCHDYLPDAHNISSPIDVKKFSEVVYSLTEAKMDKAHERYMIGSFAYFLWLFGCSKKQAFEAIAHQYRCSETKVKSAAFVVFKSYGEQETLYNLVTLIPDFESYLEFGFDDFPKDKKAYKKAYAAYRDFIGFFKCIKCLEHEPTHIQCDKALDILRKKYPVVMERGQIDPD
ncbi:MAG: hypothetical protein VYC19_09470 [Pseudomonadota bacterium]|jgi:hypothetical protein|nr:hypothetical protein [Pseudomonadota bacterium]